MTISTILTLIGAVAFVIILPLLWILNITHFIKHLIEGEYFSAAIDWVFFVGITMLIGKVVYDIYTKL